MKKIYSTFTFLLINMIAFSQWQPTHVSEFSNETVYDMVEHNGELYAAINNKGLVKYNGTDWDSVPASGFVFNPNSIHIERIASAGNYLYAVVQNQSCATSMVYKSIDNGLTFTADTSGLPVASCNGQPQNVTYLYALGTKLVAVLNIGTYVKGVSDPTWIANTDPDTQFAEKWEEFNGKWYAWYNYKVHVSNDNGSTWSTPTNTNIPSFFSIDDMNLNPTNGRLYVSGKSFVSPDYRLFYSDDEGVTWDSIPVSQYLGLSWIGNQQRILDIYSNGNEIYLNLDNNANSSHPDMLVSTNGGTSFSVDTTGLNSNSFGTAATRAILVYDNDVFAAFNFHDIYKRGGGTTGVIEENTDDLLIYPNPTSDDVNFYTSEVITEIKVYNMEGKLVLTKLDGDIKGVDLFNLKRGVYLMNLKSKERSIVRRINKL